MTDFSQFKTCKKYGFFNKNTPNDVDIVKTFSVWKSTDFYSSRAILPFYPNVVPAPAFSAALFRSRRRKLCIAYFRAKHEKYAHAVAPPLPKKSNDFSGTPTVLAKSYPIRTVIQLFSTSGLICPSMSSHREGQKYNRFAKKSQKIYIPQ